MKKRRRKKLLIIVTLILIVLIIIALRVLKFDQDGVLHIKNFGAIGDGKTDDTEAFIEALDAIEEGEILYIDKGTYLIDNLRIINDDITIKGDKDSLLVCREIANPFVKIIGENVRFSSINIDGDRKAIRGINVMSESEGIIIENCNIENIFDNNEELEISAIKIYGDCDNILIDGCTIKNVEATPDGKEGNGTGAARGIIVNPFEGNGEGNSTNIIIKNNTISHIYPREDGDGVVIKTIEDIELGETTAVIKENTFNYCSKRAIKLLGEGVEVVGNIIYNDFEGVKEDWSDGMYAGISVLRANNDVKENEILGKSYYMPINVAGDNLENINIENNIINVAEENTVRPFRGGISVIGYSDTVNISKNTISGSYHGIYIRTSMVNSNITENTIDESNNGHGIYLDDYNYDEFKNIEILGNNISSKQYSVIVSDGIDILIKDNELNSEEGAVKGIGYTYIEE